MANSTTYGKNTIISKLKFISSNVTKSSDDIKHMLVDGTGLILTAARDKYDRTIKVVETF